MNVTIIRNPKISLEDGEEVYHLTDDEILTKQIFPDELTIRIMNTINILEVNPETKLIYNNNELYAGTMFEYNDDTYFVYTKDKDILDNVLSQLSQRDILLVRIPINTFVDVIKNGFAIQIPYMTRMMFINEIEESYLLPIITVVENRRIKDFITDRTFEKYENLFVITEISPSEYGKVRFMYMNNNIYVIRTSFYKNLTILQKETINNIIDPLYNRLMKLYKDLGNSLEDILKIHDDFVFSNKKINDVIIKQPYLFLYLFKPEYFKNIRNLIMDKIKSIDQTIILDALKKYTLNYKEMKAYDPETVLLKFMLSDPELINFVRMVDVVSDWLVIYDEITNDATDEIRYQGKTYYTTYVRNKKFSEVYNDKVLYVYPLTQDEKTIQFTDVELILKLYGNI